MNLSPILTAAGLNAVINTTNDGLQARIVSIALGDSAWLPDHSATSLVNERARVPITGSTRVNPSQLHVTAVERGEVEYWVREIGFYLEDGTLLAVWSQPDVDRPLAYKAADVDLLLGFDLVLSALPAESVVIEDAGGLNLGPATTGVAGVVQLATVAEVQDGTRNDVAISPQSLNDTLANKIEGLLPVASSDNAGIAQYATNEEAVDRMVNNRMITPAQLMQVHESTVPQKIAFGPVQLTGWLNHWDAVVNYTVPPGTVMVGLYSVHLNSTEDRRWRVRYQPLLLVNRATT